MTTDHHTHPNDRDRRDSGSVGVGSGKEPDPDTTSDDRDAPTAAAPTAEPARQQQQPLQSTDELTQPGILDTDQELDEFLADLDTTLTATVAEIRNDVAWLKQAARALLHHYRISLDRACQPDHEDSPPTA